MGSTRAFPKKKMEWVPFDENRITREELDSEWDRHYKSEKDYNSDKSLLSAEEHLKMVPIVKEYRKKYGDELIFLEDGRYGYQYLIIWRKKPTEKFWYCPKKRKWRLKGKRKWYNVPDLKTLLEDYILNKGDREVTKTCRNCGKSGLYWMEHGGKWYLCDESGKHFCKKKVAKEK